MHISMLKSRIRSRRTLSLLAAASMAAGGLALTAAAPAEAAGSAFPAHYAAPYLRISGFDAGDMAADEAATGLKYYTLAFLIPQSGCTPEWEDDGSAVGAFNSQISSLQASGGNVIISFGGADGGELAQTCTNVSSLTSAAYNMMGLTPIAGQNDDNEYFSTANASTLESFAASNGVGELSFWEVDGYDKPTGYQYSSIFNQITGTSGVGGGTTATGQITGYEGLCLDDRSASTTPATRFRSTPATGRARSSGPTSRTARFRRSVSAWT